MLEFRRKTSNIFILFYSGNVTTNILIVFLFLELLFPNDYKQMIYQINLELQKHCSNGSQLEQVEFKNKEHIMLVLVKLLMKISLKVILSFLSIDI